MGNRSKSQEPGAFGQKTFTASGVAVVRPNRGRNRWKHRKLHRKGARPIKVGKVVLQNAAKQKEITVKTKPKMAFAARIQNFFRPRKKMA